MTNTRAAFTRSHQLLAWSVHLFTASAACLGMLTLFAICQQHYTQALWFMAGAVVVDAVDGTFARLVRVKSVLPNLDGALLDNIVDYLNYVITPGFFLLMRPGMLPADFAVWIVMAIVVVSAYQFCQSDAKTPDHFFKGFPCYWNITVYYLYIFNTGMETNMLVLLTLCILIFVPIKYVYPSRLDYLTDSRRLKIMMHAFSLIYGTSSLMVLWNFPAHEKGWLMVSIGYVVIYLALSIYRTCSPLLQNRFTMAKSHASDS